VKMKVKEEAEEEEEMEEGDILCALCPPGQMPFGRASLREISLQLAAQFFWSSR